MHVETVIVGSGCAGIAMAEQLRRRGADDFVVLERAEEVGGTWRDNTYPGCACDVPSHLYSFSFAPNPQWRRTYSGQADILEYLRRTVDERGLRPRIRLGEELLEAAWDPTRCRWQLRTNQRELSARFLVSAAGPLTEPTLPDVPGLEAFEGDAFHSARWDHGVPLAGRRVAVVGTGASAIQIVPRIQREVGELVVVQRTPPWVLPHRDRRVSGLERRVYAAIPPAQRVVRALSYWSRELLVPAFVRPGRAMRVVERAARRHLRRQIADPQLRRELTPSYRIGCKRILLSNEWYPALQRDNVTVVPHGLRRIEPDAIVTADGARHEVDVIVFATGFEVTDPVLAQRVRDGDGTTLAARWDGIPRAYMGTSVPRFPNLFLLLGPNTGLGHNSVLFMIEAQTRFVLDAMRLVEDRAADALDVTGDAATRFDQELQARLQGTVWTSGGCSSWYLDRNGDNRALWPTFTWRYWLRARSLRARDYRLLRSSDAPRAASAGPVSSSAERSAS